VCSLRFGVPDRDVELAVKDQEELVGVAVHVPEVLALRVRDPDVVVVHAGHDPRAVDIVEGGQRLGQIDGFEVHVSIVSESSR
jgi:hypothetical protein